MFSHSCPHCYGTADLVYSLSFEKPVSCELCVFARMVEQGREKEYLDAKWKRRQSEADARWEENKEKARKLEASLRAKFIEPIKRLRKL